MYEEDPRFAGHYFLDSRSMTWALNAMILLAYMNVCLLQRHTGQDCLMETIAIRKNIICIFVRMGWMRLVKTGSVIYD